MNKLDDAKRKAEEDKYSNFMKNDVHHGMM
jgi:hypothetical protein